MHLALDASRVTVARRTGTERYALNLIRAIAVALEVQGQVDHGVEIGAGVAGDEVRDNLLLRFSGCI